MVGSVTPPPSGAVPETAVAPAPATPRLARFIGHTSRGALWADGARLGALEFDSGSNMLVVTMPRAENVECAAWTDDGSLLAAVSSAGSVALWNREGELLSELPGKTQVSGCSASDFTYALSVRRVLIAAGSEGARLLGEHYAAELAEDSRDFQDPTFSSNGQRLFAKVGEDRVRVVDTLTARALTELPGSYEHLAVSDDGRFLALQNGSDEVDLYDASSLTILQTVRGEIPAFHLDMLVVRRRGSGDGISDSIAYRLEPFAKRWEQREIAIYDERRVTATPWRVGMAKAGYSVFDVRTGRTLASWRASGYGCGYQWVWEKGMLAFLEGDLLTFWNSARGARVHKSACAGALAPIFTADRSRFIGFDSIWDVGAQRLVARLEMTMGGEVHGFSRDERLVIGETFIDDSQDPELVGWSTSSGRIEWHRRRADIRQSTMRVGWYLAGDEHLLVFVDPMDGRLVRIGILIDPALEVEMLLFDDDCWSGPKLRPIADDLPPNLPNRNCPELTARFWAMVGAQSQARE